MEVDRIQREIDKIIEEHGRDKSPEFYMNEMKKHIEARYEFMSQTAFMLWISEVVQVNEEDKPVKLKKSAFLKVRMSNFDLEDNETEK